MPPRIGGVCRRKVGQAPDAGQRVLGAEPLARVEAVWLAPFGAGAPRDLLGPAVGERQCEFRSRLPHQQHSAGRKSACIDASPEM